MEEELFPGGYLAPASGIAVSKGDGQLEAETSSLVSVNSATVCKSRPITGTLTGKVRQKSNGSKNLFLRDGLFWGCQVLKLVLECNSECH